MEKETDIIKSLQEVFGQMKEQDIEEYGEEANEVFACPACGEDKILAGSVPYEDYRLCNECAMMAEISMKLGKIKDMDEFFEAMEDKRLESLCEYIKKEEARENN